ncbi:MAG: DUF1836 domain-containing protein [Clostridiales Family XIII bacterium]|nr:DUF1836 domain-containing protein [Clostridiales Family XIII bacterium]
MVRYEEFIRKFAGEFAENSVIDPEDFPDMELYADQVAELINARLAVYGKKRLLTASMINDFVKKGLLRAPQKKKYDRGQMIMMELILCLRAAYTPEDVAAVMRPFVENSKTVFDEKIDFESLYKALFPLYMQQRREAADRIVARVDVIKEAMREFGLDDDDTIEIFLVLLSMAAEADTAMYIGKRVLREYFDDSQR